MCTAEHQCEEAWQCVGSDRCDGAFEVAENHVCEQGSEEAKPLPKWFWVKAYLAILCVRGMQANGKGGS